MTANAPYYQMRSQFTNVANAQFVPDKVDEYDLSASATPHDATLYTDHQPSETPPIHSLENHNFVELLEAATTAAAGQATMNTGSTGSGTVASGKGKRKRVSSPPIDTFTASQDQEDTASAPKRARVDIPTDPQLSGDPVGGRSENSSVPPSGESLLNDARAAGVHSAAALFRRSSEKSSRKYTRPPMSKLFMSLQLTPENFLQLQGQAKSYMLDPEHPERQDCVGNRGKGDTDMIKLRLFNCVRDFLDDGVGEQFFGRNVEKPGEKDAFEAARALGEDEILSDERLLWPRDGNKIISLVTPLLRRIITNERQRMYAKETRKGGAKQKEASTEATPAHEDDIQGMSAVTSPRQNFEQPHATLELTHLHPLAPAQQHGQHSNSALTISSLPTHSSRTMAEEITFLDGQTSWESPRSSIELFPGKKLELPTEQDAEPFIKHIQIFLTKNKIRIGQVRYKHQADAPLFFYSWEEMNQRIRELIRGACVQYPQLQDQANSIKGMAPEALRGLAVAATEMQNEASIENANSGSTVRIDSITIPEPSRPSTDSSSTRAIAPSSRPPSPPLPSDAFGLLSDAPLPYRLESVWSLGLKDIRDSSDWENVKNDIAFATWSDQVVNVAVVLL